MTYDTWGDAWGAAWGTSWTRDVATGTLRQTFLGIPIGIRI